MNIQIISDEKKPLLKKREIMAKLGYDNQTPSRLEIRKGLAKKLGVKEELVVVNRIKPYYGTPAADLEVVIYDDENALKELEADYLVNRHLPKKEKEKKEEEKREKKEEAKPREKKPEGKKEESKEGKKEEAKPEEKKPEGKKEESKEGKKEEEKKK